MLETSTASSAAPGISPADIAVGQEVNIESRTWAGINKPGGHATLTKIHYDEPTGVATQVDVKYVLGGRETNVELTYVKAHVELSRRSRSRRSDVKMNLESLGGAPENNNAATTGKGKGGSKGKSSPTKGKKGQGGKKRKALASIDKNNGKAKKSAKKSGSSSKKNDEPSRKVAEAEIAVEDETTLASIKNDDKAKVAKKSNAEKTVKSSKKETDGVEIAQDPTPVARAVDEKWTLIKDGKLSDYTAILTQNKRISYWWSDEDGWLHGTVSKPLAKVTTSSTIRWTIRVNFDNGDKHILTFHPLEKRWKYSDKKPVADEQKSVAAKKTTVKKPTKPVGEKVKPSAKVDRDDKKAKATKNPTAKAAESTKQQHRPAPAFGSNLQAKIKEISSRIHSAKTSSPADDDGLARKSPQDMEEKTAHASASQMPNSKAGKPKALSAKAACAKESAVPKSGSNSAKSTKAASGNVGARAVTMESLYKKECGKADKFVDFMTSSSNKKVAAAPPPSPESSEGDLELKLDQERVGLFNSILSKIMLRPRLDEMDVETMITQLNEHHQSPKPFTLLEIKPYIQKLHDDSRIFFVEEEGKMGTCYAI